MLAGVVMRALHNSLCVSSGTGARVMGAISYGTGLWAASSGSGLLSHRRAGSIHGHTCSWALLRRSPNRSFGIVTRPQTRPAIVCRQ